jgi:hypothetical protein
MTAPGGLLERLASVVRSGMSGPGRRTGAPRGSDGAQRALEDVGLLGVGWSSPDEQVAEWEKKLWHDQDDLLEERIKEWRQHLHYVANEQFIAYHRDRRMWIPRKTVPWRIRSVYNVMAKAVKIRTARLTENKPALSVQATRPDRSSIEKAEYKETLFWFLWDVLSLHGKIKRARRWACKAGSGFLKAGWDPDAGCEYPATIKVPRYEQQPAEDPATGMPAMKPDGSPMLQQQLVGVDEVYVDAQQQPLGPVETKEPDPDRPGETRRVRAEPPPGTAYYNDGQAFVDVASPFEVRWDKYEDDLWDSWYIQHAKVLPSSTILSMLGEKARDILRDATPATEDEIANRWSGLTERGGQIDVGGPSYGSDLGQQQTTQPIDKPYLVRETWVFPKTAFLKRLWGKHGALITTVGGVLAKKEPLPEWARKACPFVQFIDTPEEGNHYAKPALRDLVPIQDDLNRSRSHMAERLAILSRLIFTAPKGHGLNLRVLGGMPAMLLETRGQEFTPQPLQLQGNDGGASREFYDTSLAAAADVGDMNEASTGKLPSAGLAAKAIYALQYADERNVSEVSTEQDEALKRLAKVLDAITRTEYTEARKVRVAGADFAFMPEQEILPEDLDVEVDYLFQPGSMLSRQKEAVKNELITLREQGLVDDYTVRKVLSSAVPDAFRQGYGMQEAAARRKLQYVLRNKPMQPPSPDPWESPDIFLGVIEEFLLSARYELMAPDEKASVMQLWQAYKLGQMQAQAQAAQTATAAPGGGGTSSSEPVGAPPGGDNITRGSEQLAQTAESEVAPPPGFGNA